MKTNTQNIYSFDKLGRLTHVQFPNGTTTKYRYDEDGNKTIETAIPAIAAAAVALPSTAFAKRIAADIKNNGMIIMLDANQLIGWGENTTGMLSAGSAVATDNLPKIPLFDPGTTVPPATASIVDWAFTNANLYVVYSNGWAYSCGLNDYGQNGHGDAITVNRTSLKRIESLVGKTITKVWAVGTNTGTNGGGCAYFQDSAYNMYGCGLNLSGNLGNSTVVSQLSIVSCLGLSTTAGSHVIDVQAAATGTNISTYMLMSDGGLFVAGYNVSGQLGIGSVVNQTAQFISATTASGSPAANVKQVSANCGSTTGGNALFVDTSGAVYSSGYNGHGEMGSGTTLLNKFTQITGALAGVVVAKAELGGGFFGFGYAIDVSGNLYNWGYNGQNNLFRGGVATPAAPAQVSAANMPTGSIVAVLMNKGGSGAATAAQMTVVTTDGKVGYSGVANGQLGVSMGNYNQLPQLKSVADGSVHVIDAFMHGTALTQRMFILTDDGNLWGCGNNADGLCTGGYASSAVPASTAWAPVNLG